MKKTRVAHVTLQHTTDQNTCYTCGYTSTNTRWRQYVLPLLLHSNTRWRPHVLTCCYTPPQDKGITCFIYRYTLTHDDDNAYDVCCYTPTHDEDITWYTRCYILHKMKKTHLTHIVTFPHMVTATRVTHVVTLPHTMKSISDTQVDMHSNTWSRNVSRTLLHSIAWRRQHVCHDCRLLRSLASSEFVNRAGANQRTGCVWNITNLLHCQIRSNLTPLFPIRFFLLLNDLLTALLELRNDGLDTTVYIP